MVTVAYLAAGMSSRYKNIKQFAKINGKYLFHIILDQLKNIKEITKIIVIVNPFTKKLFETNLGKEHNGIKIHYLIQSFDKEKRDKPWGTAEALDCLKNITEPVIICNSDEIYHENLYKTCINHVKNYDSSTSAVIAYKLNKMMPEHGKVNRGIIYQKNNMVYKISEMLGVSKPLKKYNLTGDELCNVNFFVFYPSHLKKIRDKVQIFKEKNKNERKKECLLPCVINDLLNEKLKLVVYKTETNYNGVTNPGDEKFINV